MEYKVEIKTLTELVRLYEKGKINLTPPYQRNAIWTLNAQFDLIDSIKHNFPLPTFFLRELPDGRLEMVDGQQRTRAILRYFNTTDLNGNITEDLQSKKRLFNNYKIPISIITKLEDNEKIEEFYFRVNSTGLHLNRPEKIKSKYLGSNLLKLSEEILNNPLFDNLNIFTATTKRRMLDRDFIEEIIVLMHSGITDKKKQVDRLYERDFTDEEVKNVKEEIFSILNIINKFNDYQPINKTRYRQRNDLYTLFSFLKFYKHLPNQLLMHFYKILLVIDKEIRPSENTCEVFMDYALKCVSQSNSKEARIKRFEILRDILLNEQKSPTSVQEEIKDYYDIVNGIIEFHDITTFDIESLETSINNKLTENQTKHLL